MITGESFTDQHVAELEEGQGWTVVEDGLTPDEIDALREEALAPRMHTFELNGHADARRSLDWQTNHWTTELVAPETEKLLVATRLAVQEAAVRAQSDLLADFGDATPKPWAPRLGVKTIYFGRFHIGGAVEWHRDDFVIAEQGVIPLGIMAVHNLSHQPRDYEVAPNTPENQKKADDPDQELRGERVRVPPGGSIHFACAVDALDPKGIPKVSYPWHRYYASEEVLASGEVPISQVNDFQDISRQDPLARKAHQLKRVVNLVANQVR